jgi:hypothetical protein
LGRLQPGNYIPPGAGPTQFGPPCIAVRVPLNPPASLDLLICQPSTGSAAAMQLHVRKVTHRTRFSWQESPGMPRLLCDLDHAQAEYVLQHGVPQSLKDAMLAAEPAVSWDGWMLATPVPPDIRVDPAPHFPP